MTWLDFWKSQFQCPKFIIKKRNNCRKTQMLWHGKSVVAHGSRKTKKMICWMEGKYVVAYGCLNSSARGGFIYFMTVWNCLIVTIWRFNQVFAAAFFSNIFFRINHLFLDHKRFSFESDICSMGGLLVTNNLVTNMLVTNILVTYNLVTNNLVTWQFGNLTVW